MASRRVQTPLQRLESFDPWNDAVRRTAARSAQIWQGLRGWQMAELEYGQHEKVSNLQPCSVIRNWMLSFRRARRVVLPAGSVLGSMTMSSRCHVDFSPNVTITNAATVYPHCIADIPPTVRIGILHVGGRTPIDICDNVVRLPGMPAAVVMCLRGMRLGNLVRCKPLQYLQPFTEAVIVDAFLEVTDFGSWTFLVLDRSPLWNELLHE